MSGREEYNILIDAIHYFKLAKEKMTNLMNATTDPDYYREVVNLNEQIENLENKKFNEFTNGVRI